MFLKRHVALVMMSLVNDCGLVCVKYTSLVSELKKFLEAVKDELKDEVQSQQLFPFEQADITHMRLG